MKPTFHYKDVNAPKPDLPYHFGCAAIIRYKDSILLEQRKDNGEWGLVGGSLAEDEDAQQCVLREIKEETGLDLSHPRLIGIFSHPSRIIYRPHKGSNRSITAIFGFTLESLPYLRISDESLDLRFVKIQDIFSYQLVATHKHIIEDYFSAKAFPIIR
ncbi:MAG: NUDIX hydrolase [Nanoarchaeota archaeon]